MAKTTAVLLVCLSSAAAQATLFTELQLAQLPADRAQFVLPGDAGEATLTITEVGAASPGSMAGSDLFGYQGLWLGGPGLGGRYVFNFSQPVGLLSFSFIALTALGVNGEDGVESLGRFVTDRAVSTTFSSPTGSASWDGASVTPLDDDGRGTLQFQAVTDGFTVLQFDHLQPAALNGFVINRIEHSPAVPEPSIVLLSLAGALVLLARRHQRPPIQGAFAARSCAFVSRSPARRHLR